MMKLKSMAITRASTDSDNTVPVFDFSDSDQIGLWEPVNDVIMGGRSHSELRDASQGAAEFAGKVVPVGEKGFASVRTIPAKVNLAGFDGLLLAVRGDGRTYKLNLTDNRSPQGLLYQVRFDPGTDEWVHIRVPFDDLMPTNRGQVLSARWVLDKGGIRTFGLMIGDNQPGAFSLKLREIRAYASGDEG